MKKINLFLVFFLIMLSGNLLAQQCSIVYQYSVTPSSVSGYDYKQGWRVRNQTSGCYASNYYLVPQSAQISYNNGATWQPYSGMNTVFYRNSGPNQWNTGQSNRFSVGAWSYTSININFNVSPANTGKYRMYFDIYDGNGNVLPVLSGGRLWTEFDYTVPTPCSNVSSLHVNSKTHNSCEVDWTGYSGSTYDVRYRVSGSSSWNYKSASSSVLNLTGLSSNTTYQWAVIRYCSNGGTSSWTSNSIFTTDPAPITCSSVYNLHVNSKTHNSCEVDWTGLSSTSYYRVRYRINGSNSWSYATTSSSYYNLTGLSSNTTYQWAVERYCSNGGTSSWTSNSTFTTDPAPTPFNLQLTSPINVSPNPLIKGQNKSITATVTNNGGQTFYGIIEMAWHNLSTGSVIALQSTTNLNASSNIPFSVGGTVISDPGNYQVKVKYKENTAPGWVDMDVENVQVIDNLPNAILSPVVGGLTQSVFQASQPMSTSSKPWSFWQEGPLHNPGHDVGQGIGGADDTYAWDINKNYPTWDDDDGKPIYAVADGVIMTNNDFWGWGGSTYGQILIQHNTNGTIWYSGYLHCANITSKKSASTIVGRTVSAGEHIGDISNISGGSVTPHLHFAIYREINGVLVSEDRTIQERSASTLPAGVVTMPQLNLSSSSVALGGNLTITGKNFTPYYDATLSFSGASGNFSVTIACDANGEFSYIYTASSILNTTINNKIQVRGYDTFGKQHTNLKTFWLGSVFTPSSTYLNVITPKIGGSYEVNTPVAITFEDKLQQSYNGYYYPMKANTAERMYGYEISYQAGTGSSWQVIRTVTGSDILNKNITLTEIITLPTINNSYKIRVTDIYQNTIIAESEIFSIMPSSSGLKADLLWDYSFIKPYISPKGVAADGVSRLYIRLQKEPGTTNNLSSATITLSDGTNTTIEMLGKVKPAIEIRKYSTEANDADQISTTASANPINDEIWFWYVAPDDFSQSNSSSYSNASQRTVTANITATMVNGTTIQKAINIAVVRPPLMMVHGLGSNEYAFENFKYTENNNEKKFIDSELFVHRKAVNVSPNGSFAENAEKLLSSDTENSLQGNIDKLRKHGYAANQVDYICHSMGGLMLRTAMTQSSDKYYGTNSFIHEPYKSYGKGFVHKFITINSPHGGSPFADLIAEFTPDAPLSARAGLTALYYFRDDISLLHIPSFIQPTNFSNPFAYEFGASPAVSDLRVDGGPSLSAINDIKHHYIVGDVDLVSSDITTTLASMEYYVKFLDELLSIAVESPNLPASAKSYLKGTLALTKVVRVFTFLEWYNQEKGYPNFLADSDLIVPLGSQLSRLPFAGLPSTLPTNSTSFSGFSGNHLSIVNRLDVGNKVKELLNLSMSNPSFGNTIPAVPKMASNDPPLTNVQLLKNSTSQNVSTTTIDTSKIVLTSPTRNSVAHVDSAFTFQYRLKDTVNLLYTSYLFQTNKDVSTDTVEYHNITLQVEPNMLGRQTIWVTAVYQDNLGATTHYMDSLSVTVRTNQNLSRFETSQKYVTLYKGDDFSPSYIATYPTFVTEIPNNDTDLSVSIANSNIIAYSNNKFYALDTLSTFSVVSYQGFSDTIYFNVLDSTITNYECNVQISVDSLIPTTVGINDGKISLSLNDSTDMVVEWLDSLNLESLTRVNLSAGSYTIRTTNAYTLCSDSVTLNIVEEVLPVELLYFTGKITEIGNHLEWKTVSELNNQGFNIQRFFNGNWQTLGFVEGNGTTIEMHEYNFLDENPIKGHNYYRLEQVDFDETRNYSNVIDLELKQESVELAITLYPNPTSGILNIEVGEIGEIPTFQVFDISGRLISVNIQNVGTNQWQLNTIDLPNGSYFLQMKQGEQVLNKKFVIAH